MDTKVPGRRRFHLQALQLTQTIDTLTKQQQWGSIKEKAAFLKLLGKCLEDPHELLRQRFDLLRDKNQEAFQLKLREVITAEAEQDPAQPLITDKEKQFIFLTANAGYFVGEAKIEAIKRQVYFEKISVKKASWLIAVALYEKYKKAENSLLKKRQLLEGILLGYLHNRYPDFMTFKRELLPTLAPLSVGDYLFYRMTDAALATVLEPRKAEAGPYLMTLWDEMQSLKVRHDKEHPALVPVDVPLQGRYQPDVIRSQREAIRPPLAYDHYLHGKSSVFVREINKKFRKLKSAEEKDKLKNFVRNLNVLDVRVRDLQAKLSKLKELQATPEVQDQFFQQMQQDIKIVHKQLDEKVAQLKIEAQELFYQGKPSSLARKIIGIGVLIISGIVLTLALVSFFLAPPSAALMIGGTTVAYKALAGTIAGVNGVSMLAGGLVTFSSLEKKPATIASVTGSMIAFIEAKGREAILEIKDYEHEHEHEHEGVSSLYQ
jgi:hypothetical protein